MRTEIPGRNRTGHGGNIHAVVRDVGRQYGKVKDFSANINPLGPPEWLRSLISRELDGILHYPDPDYSDLVSAIADFHSVNRECIIPANGSTDLLYLLPRLLPCTRAVIPVPSYIDYIKAVKLAGLEYETITLQNTDDFSLNLETLARGIRPGDLVIFATPNNPTGSFVEPASIIALAADFPETFFLIDEAFLDFVEGGECVGGRLPNLLTLNSMTKFFGVPGLRLGFGVFPTEIAESVREYLPPWTLNSLAQAFGIRCLQDTAYHERTRQEVCKLRQGLVESLQNIDHLRIYPSRANYLLIQLTNGLTAPELAKEMLAKGILIRCCDNYQGLDDTYFRVAVRTAEENRSLCNSLYEVLHKSPAPAVLKRKAPTPAIMFQGTSSNAGKSVLTAALCRILLQDGVRVAPFKAQNMSLNSFVTRNGEEMGRAQVVQAQAAKLDPDVRMNPILLKPNSDTGSQIIVNGYPVGNMSVLDYGKYKDKAWEAARSAYDSLASEYEVVVLEGAGSPGEVNLKAEDIVNMRMAAYANAPVLLVGDIDRGGVYASFVGTMEVLSAWERELIAGFVVNRFRGQASLLESAHKYLIDHTGKEALGVVPYLADLGLPEEDSVSFKAGLFNKKADSSECVEIALINFPHISNFTDVEPFLAEPDVTLRIINTGDDLGNPDVIILPGSKNVIGDLQFLRSSGFIDLVKQKAVDGCEVVGICGGYQILGKTVEDPHGIESVSGSTEAMGLLELTTELKQAKTLTRQRGIHTLSGLEVYGYEIHHGISSSQLSPVLQFENGRSCGSASTKLQVWGTYLHGIFDSDPFRRWFIDTLRKKKGLPAIGRIMAPYDLEASFDRLADTVRSNLDMEKVYRLLDR